MGAGDQRRVRGGGVEVLSEQALNSERRGQSEDHCELPRVRDVEAVDRRLGDGAGSRRAAATPARAVVFVLFKLGDRDRPRTPQSSSRLPRG